jgi:hypothetical protein
MKINEIAKPEVIYELEKWAKTQVPLLEGTMSAEKLGKTLLQKAMNKFKKQPEASEEKNKEMEEYMARLEYMLDRDEKVEKTILQKFFGFFRAHPRMIGLGVMILMLLSPILPQIAIIGLSLEKILSVTLAGLYAIDIASPAVKTALEI